MVSPARARFQSGACCSPNGGCLEDVSPSECATSGGEYQGDGSICSQVMCPQPVPDRISATEKGSLVIFSKVDIRWDDMGSLLQDTFLSLTNDYPQDVLVQMYFINGDPPLDAAGGERAHPGWNWVDNEITLTDDQPTYWSALTGQPAAGGLSPFTALDPGFPPGRPAPGGGRMLRGFILAWAVDASNCQIRWNHLKGEGTIVNYALGSAWEYNSWNARMLLDGELTTGFAVCGHLALDGVEYAEGFAQLLMDFQAVGASSFSGPRQVVSDTDLTLLPCGADLTQETCGPITTKASFDVWNMNEVKFSGTHRCVTCWDETLLSDYDPPNHFLIQTLQTDHGKARIDGLASQLCDVDADPSDGIFPPENPCDPDEEESHHPDDVVSQDAPLLGVVARLLTFDGGADHDAAGTNLVGMGYESCDIYYDTVAPPPEADIPSTPRKLLDWIDREPKATRKR